MRIVLDERLVVLRDVLLRKVRVEVVERGDSHLFGRCEVCLRSDETSVSVRIHEKVGSLINHRSRIDLIWWLCSLPYLVLLLVWSLLRVEINCESVVLICRILDFKDYSFLLLVLGHFAVLWCFLWDSSLCIFNLNDLSAFLKSKHRLRCSVILSNMLDCSCYFLRSFVLSLLFVFKLVELALELFVLFFQDDIILCIWLALFTRGVRVTHNLSSLLSFFLTGVTEFVNFSQYLQSFLLNELCLSSLWVFSYELSL